MPRAARLRRARTPFLHVEQSPFDSRGRTQSRADAMKGGKLKVYAYSGCSTCRNALKFLAEHEIPHEVVPIRETPPKPAELRRMLEHKGGEIRRLFNTSGLDYKAQGL